MSEDGAAELYALRCATEPPITGRDGRWRIYRKQAEWFATQLDAAVLRKIERDGKDERGKGAGNRRAHETVP